MKNLTRKITTGAMLVAALALYNNTANAASVSNLLNTGDAIDGQNTLVDDNREYIIDRVGENGALDVGDSLRGHAIWSKLNGSPLGFGTNNNEMTSVFQIMVTSKTEVAPGEYEFTFGPDPSFTEASALGLGGRAMMVFYEDSTPDAALDYDDPTSPLAVNSVDDGTVFSPPSSEDVGTGANAHEEAFIATATDGQYFWALGYTGAVVDGVATAADGEGWASVSGHTDSMYDYFQVDSGNDLSSFNFSLNRTLTAGLTGIGESIVLREEESYIDSAYNVQFNGSSTLEGVRNERTAFEASSQSTLTFAAIPLPPAVWMGAMMLSDLGGIRYFSEKTSSGELTVE